MKSNLLPVYTQKDKILNALETNSVIVVESPTGSGKTTQMPIILHEAGYSQRGIIGVTQPRRIAVLSVSEFIAKQLKKERPDLIGYKMRFADVTDERTQIKIMTDGILLQELKLDPYLSKYSMIMVDEAHERSLNIDFILGLLKRIIKERDDFKVIISSATINTELFSSCFNNCPIIKIDAFPYPITLIFDPPSITASTENMDAENALYDKITTIIERIIREKRKGGILVFLPGERSIKNCIERLSKEKWYRKLWVVPLYGRLSKEEQDRVFLSAPFTKRKVVISTNIAETSITINDINTVIDSGLAKLNFYNPYTYTSSLDESLISKSSCNQRRGRAGRTEPGTCYRLYTSSDFESRPLYTTEEIYRTDLSEVVMRMSELGIYNFENFDFISPTSRTGVIGAIETLKMLQALESDRSLSRIGELMCKFPLPPRQSRIIAEAIFNYPDVMEEVLIATSFLSVRTPFTLPDGYETEARKAHAIFSDDKGDFVSFLKAYRMFLEAKDKETFCKNTFLDIKIMEEIINIKEQLTLIVSNLGVPILSSGKMEEYLTCIATGMIQGVCFRYKRGVYKSLTTEKIVIHPSSCMYRQEPEYIVAGEIVRTSRMYAMSVSSLSKDIIKKVAPSLIYTENEIEKARKVKKDGEKKQEKQKHEDSIEIFDILYPIYKVKGKKMAFLDFHSLQKSLVGRTLKDIDKEMRTALRWQKKVLGVLEINKYKALEGEKINKIVYLLASFDIKVLFSDEVKPFLKVHLKLPEDVVQFESLLPFVMKLTLNKSKSKELAFVALYYEKRGSFTIRLSKGFSSALHETSISLQIIMDRFLLALPKNIAKEIEDLYSKLLKI